MLLRSLANALPSFPFVSFSAFMELVKSKASLFNDQTGESFMCDAIFNPVAVEQGKRLAICSFRNECGLS